MDGNCFVMGQNDAAPFSLKLYRGDGMALVATNWKGTKPPDDFVGFAIEYKVPGGSMFKPVYNLLSFADAKGKVSPEGQPSMDAPIQKFRWAHFPPNAELVGNFVYRVTPRFMDRADKLRSGEPQQAEIALRRETYPGKLNVAYTRGFVSSQAFVRHYGKDAIPKLLPAKANQGLDFVPTDRKAVEALAWMGFEAWSAVLELLEQAIADTAAQVRVVAYDLNLPDVVSRLEKLGSRLKIIIDDSGEHHPKKSAETLAAGRLIVSAGAGNVKRQHMGKLQHNKFIVVDGPRVQAAVCGSTNFSWRGFFVQNNSAIIVRGKSATRAFRKAFDDYWAHDDVAGFGATPSAKWTSVGLADMDAQIGFSPHAGKNAVLASIADDIANKTKSNLFFSLAFLYQTPGAIRNAVLKIGKRPDVFSYGISDHKVKGLEATAGIDLQKPSGSVVTVHPEALTEGAPEPFKSEPTGGGGTRMHHKFIVMDFDKPTARVYVGSFNFSKAADVQNGENLLLIRDQRIAVSYMIEALTIFDHCHFRVAMKEAKKSGKPRSLAKSPRKPGEQPWWAEYYSDPWKIRDRELFA